MTTRLLQQIIPTIATSDGAGVKLRRSLGQSQALRFDPFLMLDEFFSDNPDDYIAGFPSHPHRGFETLTYMLEGHLLHQDHLGNQGNLKSGGVQWMTAGRGIIHSEMPQQTSGRLRGFQLWINLPAKEKMKPASYLDVQPEQIQVINLPDGGQAKIIAGTTTIEGQKYIGAIQGISTKPLFMDIRLPAGSSFSLSIDASQQAFIYNYDGCIAIGADSEQRTLEAQSAGLLSAGEKVQIMSGAKASAFLLLAANPLREPIVQYGPFVMNSLKEIEQAIDDYKNNRLV